MKTLYVLFATLLITGFTCASAQFLKVTPGSRSVGPTAGSTTFTKSGTIFNWGTTDNVSWLGTSIGGNTIKASYTANTGPAPRIATITVRDGVSKDVKVTVVQAPTSLSVSPSSRNVSKSAGSTYFTVNANVAWSVSEASSWLSVYKTSLTNFNVSWQTNPTISSRAATITVKGNGVTRTVTVTQAAGDVVLEVTPDLREVGDPAGSTSFKVTSNVPWRATHDARWLSTSAFGEKLSVSYDKNNSTDSRSEIILVSGGGESKKVQVKQAGADPYLNVSPDSENVGSNSGAINFSVSTNVGWSVSDDASWLTATKTNGITIGVSFDENTLTTPRTANITATGTGGLSETVTVTQDGAAPYLDVSPDSKSVDSKSGSTSFSVDANVEWTVSDDVSWLTATKTDGTTIGVSYDKNSSTDPRTASITAIGDGLGEIVTVTQAGASPYIIVSPDSENVNSKSGTISFNVNANVNWTVSDDVSWLTATKTDGHTISVSYDKNTSTNARTANITASGGGESETVTVTQAGATAVLDVSPDSESVSAESGTISFSVAANVNWSVSDDASWLTASKTDGNTIGVSYEANTSTDPRTASITASGGGESETVTVTQAGATISFYIDLASNSITIGCKGGSESVTVSSNVDWSVSSSESWLAAVKKDASTLTIDCIENADENERSATVTLSGEGISRFVTVVQEKADPTSDNNFVENQKITIYPNPTSDMLFVKLNSEIGEEISIALFDIRGKMVHSQTISRAFAGEIISIDLSVFKSGIYFLRMNNSEVYKIEKL